MKKYWAIAKLYFKTQIAFRSNIALTMAFSLWHILFAHLLWSTIFGGAETVGGFTLQTMMTYYIIQAFFRQIELSDGVSGEVSARIRDGTFMKYMVIPADSEGYFMAMTAGAAGFYVIIDVVTFAALVFLFGVRFAVVGSAAVIFLALSLFALGCVFMLQLNYFLGLLTFKFQNIGIFLMVKYSLIELLTGALVPLVFLPAGFVAFARYTPFYYVNYLPAMLLVGRLREEAAPGLAVIAGWVALFIFINRYAYGRLRVRFDGVGI